MTYRREVDGLRALAVVPVILFHAGFSSFGGGFVGVDIFFVISGYLITSIILADQEKGRFSLLRFYERRARRILPALFLVMAVCVPFAWAWLLPGDMRYFSKSIVAVTLFASNILFWRESGYFEAASELKPLLHTWSLAVEEQYYLIFPLFILFTWRLGKRWIIGLLVVIAITSLIAAQWSAYNKPSAAFFLLHTRAWELAIGALLGFYLTRHREFSLVTRQVASGLGVGLVFLAIFAFTARTPFPGLYALVPTMGAALILLFASPETMVGKVLGSKLFVGIGLISYSAYLWHQPLFAFARHALMAEPSIALYLALTGATFLLAFLSWRLVETPCRDRAKVALRPLLLTIGGLVVLGFGFAALMQSTKGYPSRFYRDAAAQEFASYFENSRPAMNYFQREGILAKFGDGCNFFDTEKYRLGIESATPRPALDAPCHERDPALPKSVLVWGDSHAQMLRPGLQEVLPPDWQLLQVATSDCAPTLEARPDDLEFCKASNRFAAEAIRKAMPDVVVLSQRAKPDPDALRRLVAELKSAGVRRIVIAGPPPQWQYGLPLIVLRKFWPDVPERSFAGLDAHIFDDDRELQQIIGTLEDARYVSLVQAFCTDQGCLTHLDGDPRDGLVTWDYGHLTPPASRYLSQQALVAAITSNQQEHRKAK